MARRAGSLRKKARPWCPTRKRGRGSGRFRERPATARWRARGRTANEARSSIDEQRRSTFGSALLVSGEDRARLPPPAAAVVARTVIAVTAAVVVARAVIAVRRITVIVRSVA